MCKWWILAAVCCLLLTGCWREPEGELLLTADLDHNGKTEEIRLLKDGKDRELQIVDGHGRVLWSQRSSTLWTDWATVFFCRVGEQDYLGRYIPSLYHGQGNYRYEIFSLDGDGGEIISCQAEVAFTTRTYETTPDFDPTELADFINALMAYLDRGMILMNTNEEINQAAGPAGLLPWLLYGDESGWKGYDPNDTLEENLWAYLLIREAELLPGEYDFDHDGKPETVELVTVWEPEQERTAWYELHVKKAADGTELWSDSAAPQHPGWKSIFAHTMGEKDYLLCFYPTMYQGYADYTYEQIFFDQDGNWALSLRDAVSFDLSFNMPEHEFDAVEIAEFFWNLRGYLQNSTLLLSTENGEFQSDIPGLELQNYCFGELLALDSREKMETALRRWESEMKQEQGVA